MVLDFSTKDFSIYQKNRLPKNGQPFIMDIKQLEIKSDNHFLFCAILRLAHSCQYGSGFDVDRTEKSSSEKLV